MLFLGPPVLRLLRRFKQRFFFTYSRPAPATAPVPDRSPQYS
jgi:hypothetical protein